MLSQKDFNLALRLLQHTNAVDPVHLDDLVAELDTTKAFLFKLSSQLARAGLLVTVGHRGVLRTEETNLLVIYEALGRQLDEKSEIDMLFKEVMMKFKV